MRLPLKLHTTTDILGHAVLDGELGIDRAELTAREAKGQERATAFHVLADLYRLAATELRQYGDLDLGWISAQLLQGARVLEAGHGAMASEESFVVAGDFAAIKRATASAGSSA